MTVGPSNPHGTEVTNSASGEREQPPTKQTALRNTSKTTHVLAANRVRVGCASFRRSAGAAKLRRSRTDRRSGMPIGVSTFGYGRVRTRCGRAASTNDQCRQMVTIWYSRPHNYCGLPLHFPKALGPDWAYATDVRPSFGYGLGPPVGADAPESS